MKRRRLHGKESSSKACSWKGNSGAHESIVFSKTWNQLPDSHFQQELFGTIFLIFTFHFWFKDLLRELVIKYEVLLIIFFLVFLLFIISEGLLFCSFFWISFHSLSSPTLRTCPPEGFYLPDPCELTFANTLLLSNAAISLGNTFISLEFLRSDIMFDYKCCQESFDGNNPLSSDLFYLYFIILWRN